MKTVGLIVEYNPFHNGHLHHIEESLRITGADKAIVVMSGNFVQRGAPAIMPKHLRTEMALRSGASLVIELPVRYATGSAEFFALGAISLLHELGCVDYICFGSESGDITALSSIADILVQEPQDYKVLLQELLRSGLSFPTARQQAMDKYLETQEMGNTSNSTRSIQGILAEPNNILGIEYIKALHKLDSPMIPYTILRKTSHYHDTNLQENYSSASAIRNHLQAESEDTLITQVPAPCYEIMQSTMHKRYPIYNNDLSLLLHQRLLHATQESLLHYQDMTSDLANRILNMRNQYVNFQQFCEIVKTKNMTYARISRALLHVLLEIPSYDMVPESMNHYIRILGFRRSDAGIMNRIKECSTLPLLTKLTQTEGISEQGHTLLSEDIRSANLYESIITSKFHETFIHEYEQSIVIC